MLFAYEMTFVLRVNERPQTERVRENERERIRETQNRHQLPLKRLD